MFIDSLKEVPFYSLSFDESCKNALKKGQIDLHVRYWEDTKDHIVTRYLDSSFIGKSSTNDVCSDFKSFTEILEDEKYLQVSSDLPDVNLGFRDMLSIAGSNADVGKKLLDLGTCGLHIMHNAFKHGKNTSYLGYQKAFECHI